MVTGAELQQMVGDFVADSDKMGCKVEIRKREMGDKRLSYSLLYELFRGIEKDILFLPRSISILKGAKNMKTKLYNNLLIIFFLLWLVAHRVEIIL